jgi:hypothetical protein
MSATKIIPKAQMGDASITSGTLPNKLAEAVSAAIYSAMQSGMEPDEACCIVAAVAADYARGGYGDEYLPHLAKVITDRARMPTPDHDEE